MSTSTEDNLLWPADAFLAMISMVSLDFLPGLGGEACGMMPCRQSPSRGATTKWGVIPYSYA
jgi:hypothetical protein